MQYQIDNICYPTKLAAANAIASSQIGKVVQKGDNPSVIGVQSLSETSIIYSVHDEGGLSTTIEIPLNLQECQLLDYSDGLQMGWMVGAVWISAFAILFLVKALRGDNGARDDT